MRPYSGHYFIYGDIGKQALDVKAHKQITPVQCGVCNFPEQNAREYLTKLLDDPVNGEKMRAIFLASA